MKGQNSRAAALCQNIGQLLQKGFQHLKLAVHINPECLKGSLAGFFHSLLPLLFGYTAECFFDDSAKLCGGGHLISFFKFLHNSPGDLLCKRLV